MGHMFKGQVLGCLTLELKLFPKHHSPRNTVEERKPEYFLCRICLYTALTCDVAFMCCITLDII